MTPSSWMELSNELAALVKRAAASVVRVEGRRRGPASGTVWSADGTVVTTSHGLDWDDGVDVGLPSGEVARAEVVGRDPGTDLAVLRLPPGAAAGLAAAEWSDGAIEPGQLALAVTRPGRGPRAALGVVARVGDGWRTSAGGKVDRWVELDFGGHPGFSGGLVLDLAGRAIGLGHGGLVRGEPLAVPAATLRRVVKAVLAHGGVRRGYLGVASLPVRLPAAVAQQCGQASGLLLTAVEDDSPAARAGLMVGDVLLALDGAAVGHLGDLLPLLEEERIGDAARARVVRGGGVIEVAVTIGVRGDRAQGGGRP
ncbi:MAG TPA: S1C family serine protease [Anaeromyxobacteraceae bacterium]|nr:S1C family serine protease [Anaeromyxobacteraceae bacterium]